MNILVMNAGSSSLKYQLYNMKTQEVLAKGLVERIGMEVSVLIHEVPGQPKVTAESEILDHTIAVKKMLDSLTDAEHGILKKVTDIQAVGHRVVHGGETFSQSVLINEEVKQEIRKLFALAPLHNPAALMGIVAAETHLSHTPQVAVFDTAFHHTMPESSYLYPLPTVLYDKYQVRRYGFHGTSHDYVSQKAADFLGKPRTEMKIVTCHIGNGASCTAVLHGKSYDTSMGMTPLEGLMMGTRSGDIDPAIIPFTMEKEDLSLNEINSMLNKHSGLLGVSGVSSDMRDIMQAIEEGNEQAKVAFDMYTYRIRKYIGAYCAAMDGVDVIIFTAGVGENSDDLRKAVCDKLTFLGIQLDPERNKVRSSEVRLITTDDSKVSVFVVPTNEELVIASDTFRVINQNTTV